MGSHYNASYRYIEGHGYVFRLPMQMVRDKAIDYNHGDEFKVIPLKNGRIVLEKIEK